MAKSNNCLWVVEWARPRNGTGAAANLTWRFDSAYATKREAEVRTRDASNFTWPGFDTVGEIYRVRKYVPADKP